MRVHYFFKIFNNIKSEHESQELAKMELTSLFGNVRPVFNVLDICSKRPFSNFTSEDIRIQDSLTMELPYGRIHGYYGVKNTLENISHLIKRLAYTREIYVVANAEDKEPIELLQQIFPFGVIGKNVQFFKRDKYILFRFVTHQYFLEKSQYISKLSRNEEEIDRNVETLFRHLFTNQYRIPASSTMAVGKRLIDYFTIREEPSLYLNHYMHPYKGKFHPKMVRSLINYVYPYSTGIILDNFVGSGTTLVEAGYMELESLGIEVNPLSTLMCNVKTNSVKIPPEQLKAFIEKHLAILKKKFQELSLFRQGQQTLIFDKNSKGDKKKEVLLNRSITIEAKQKKEKLRGPLKEDLSKIEQIIVARTIVNEVKNDDIRDFLMLSLSGTISDVDRRTRKEFLEAYTERLYDLYKRIYLFWKLNEFLKIELKSSITYTADTRDMKEIKFNSIDAIVNSPPYSTALDYIRNDEPQLILLDLVPSLEDLERNMMGNPRVNFDRKELLAQIKTKENLVFKNSSEGKRYVNILINNNRVDAGLRVFKFFLDMYLSLKEMFRVQKKGTKCAIVIGNNHFKVNDHYQEIANDIVIEELGLSIGYVKDKVVYRELEKSSSGNIRKESILILKKP